MPDLKYPSLFEYAVRELKYSEGAADRRIRAMRLLKELPEIEDKIESGTLTLTNIAKAQVFLREVKRTEPERLMTREDKAELFRQLENKSTREGEKLLLSIAPQAALPKERERQVTPEHIELRMVLDQEFKAQLQEARSLLGPRGAGMTLTELLAEMTRLGVEKLKEKKFGKRRVQAELAMEADNTGAGVRGSEIRTTPLAQTPNSGAGVGHSVKGSDADLKTRLRAVRPRYIPQSVKHAVWRAAGGKCAACGTRHNLQIDHVQPVALGGTSTPDNLRILCGSCNIRRGIRTFGTAAMRRS